MKYIVSAAALMAVLGTGAIAQDLPPPVKARQGQFNIMLLHISTLGGMARGNIEYDAEAAQAAADSLVSVSMLAQAPMWPEGTDADSIEGTRAKPEIWSNFDDVVSKWTDFGEAAQMAAATVADGPEALGPALGAVGGTCTACHDDYRVPE